MLRTPSAVVFDLGKVLVDFDYSLVVRRTAARSPGGLATLERLIGESPLLYAFERGEITAERFFATIRQEAGFKGDFAEFADYFSDIFTEIPSMTALHGALRARGVPTFIFSNTNVLAIDHIRRRFPFFGGFDGYVLSFEHGVMKPEAALYRVVEQITGRRGGELLYLDDRPENVEAGLALGWQAILHRDPEESREYVRRTGLLD
jgi:putative hydrolase of the HAD superfamily